MKLYFINMKFDEVGKTLKHPEMFPNAFHPKGGCGKHFN